MRLLRPAWAVCLALVYPFLAPAARAADGAGLGLFASHTDVGSPKQAGTVTYDAAAGTYTIGGAGLNMWFKTDSFHYVWEKIEGDIALAADIAFVGTGGNAHRKGVLMIRQALDQDSAYADVALHGDGLTSLQFRETAGDVTHEVQTAVKAPKRLRLEKIGDYVYMSLAGVDGVLQPSGCSTRLPFKGPFYIGLGVCAHDDNAFETAVFSNVVLGPPSAGATAVRSSVEYVKVPSGDRVCVFPGSGRINSVEWTKDDGWRFMQDSTVFSIPAIDGSRKPVPATAVPPPPNGPSPDGKWTAAFAHQGGDAVLTLRATADGEVRELMRIHDQADAPVAIAWSPDSTKIAYVRYQPARK